MKQIPSIERSVAQPHKLAELRQAQKDWTHTPDVLSRLTRRLTTTLSLETQLGIIADELREIVPFDSLNYRHRIALQDFVFASGLGGQHKCEYRLTLEGASYGTLTLYRRKKFSEDELEGVETILGAAICSLRNACQFLAIEQTALTDSLTGVPNKRALDDSLLRASQLSDRHQEYYSLILCDLDHFKQVNDSHGHVVGDHLLQQAAACIERTLRTSDSVYRFGGEEFAILLPHTSDQDARDVADRVRKAIANIRVDCGDGKLSVTASCGVSTHLSNETPEQWLARADDALYHAKRHGRNCTQVFAAIG